MKRLTIQTVCITRLLLCGTQSLFRKLAMLSCFPLKRYHMVASCHVVFYLVFPFNYVMARTHHAYIMTRHVFALKCESSRSVGFRKLYDVALVTMIRNRVKVPS